MKGAIVTFAAALAVASGEFTCMLPEMYEKSNETSIIDAESMAEVQVGFGAVKPCFVAYKADKMLSCLVDSAAQGKVTNETMATVEKIPFLMNVCLDQNATIFAELEEAFESLSLGDDLVEVLKNLDLDKIVDIGKMTFGTLNKEKCGDIFGNTVTECFSDFSVEEYQALIKMVTDVVNDNLGDKCPELSQLLESDAVKGVFEQFKPMVKSALGVLENEDISKLMAKLIKMISEAAPGCEKIEKGITYDNSARAMPVTPAPSATATASEIVAVVTPALFVIGSMML